MCFLMSSKDEKKMVLITHERAMETPRPDESYVLVGGQLELDLGWIIKDSTGAIPLYIPLLKNWIRGILTGCPFDLVKQLRW